MRVLMLASYFPKPTNPLMGTWALSQAQALLRSGLQLEVLSFTSWVPPWLAPTPGAKAYANCPGTYQWDELTVGYPRWLVYPVGPARALTDRHPRIPMALGWHSASRTLQQAVERFKPDLVYAHHTAFNGYLANRLHQRFGIPYVITDHDFGEIESCAQWPDRARFFAPIVHRCARQVGVAQRMTRALAALFPEACTETVLNGTDPIPAAVFHTPRPPQLRDKLVIFSCGAFYERKGFPLLIEVFARVCRSHPTAILRIAGDGPEKLTVEKAIKEQGLQDRVQLLGFQPHATVIREMVWADVFALLGWDEPFATVFSEAMSAAKPILCANDGGINDVLRHEVHGLTVPPRNREAATTALNRLLSDAALRLELGNNAQRLYESQLTWDRNAARMGRIFSEALASA